MKVLRPVNPSIEQRRYIRLECDVQIGGTVRNHKAKVHLKADEVDKAVTWR